jgi:hypothetical protein
MRHLGQGRSGTSPAEPTTDRKESAITDKISCGCAVMQVLMAIYTLKRK